MTTASQPHEPIDDRSAGDPLTDLESDDVLQRRCPEYDLTWYFGLEDGQPVRYHELFDFEREPIMTEKVAAITAHPDMTTCRVGREHLEGDTVTCNALRSASPDMICQHL